MKSCGKLGAVAVVGRCVAAVIVVACCIRSAGAQVPYLFGGLAWYQFGDPADLSSLSPYHAGPDTSFFSITNNGAATFSGTIGQVAVSANGTNHSYSVSVTLNPGEHITLGRSDESSNQGGYNGPAGDPANPQPGIQIYLSGTVTLGGSSSSVSESIYDRDIHSGTFATNPFGVTLDNYILQGGDPLGRDTEDAFEVGQAPGSWRWGVVPEPTAATLAGIAVLVHHRRRRKGS